MTRCHVAKACIKAAGSVAGPAGTEAVVAGKACTAYACVRPASQLHSDSQQAWDNWLSTTYKKSQSLL